MEWFPTNVGVRFCVRVQFVSGVVVGTSVEAREAVHEAHGGVVRIHGLCLLVLGQDVGQSSSVARIIVVQHRVGVVIVDVCTTNIVNSVRVKGGGSSSWQMEGYLTTRSPFVDHVNLTK